MRSIVSIVLGTYNRLSFLKLAIDSIRKELKDVKHEIIVVDGGSNDGTMNWLCRQKDIISIIQHNRGTWNGKKIERRSWGYFMNLGFRAAGGKYICMLSDDCLVIPGAIKNGVALFEKKLSAGEKTGAVAFYWRNFPEQKKYWVGLTLGNKIFVNHGLYLKKALEEVSFIDDETCAFYFADGDLCLKLWQNGYTCIDSPESFIEHYSHANLEVRNSNSEKVKADWKNYLSKWENIFYDPKLKNIGSWIEKEFYDKTETHKTFLEQHNKLKMKKAVDSMFAVQMPVRKFLSQTGITPAIKKILK